MQTINTAHRSSKQDRRPRIILGRLEDKKSGKVIIPGQKVIGKLAEPHPMHRHLKKIVVVKVPAPEMGGYYLQRMKLKTALQKGYYKVNATNPKDRQAIEKTLEAIENTGDSHIDAVKNLQASIKEKTPNA